MIESQTLLDEETRKREISQREKAKADEAEHRRLLNQRLREDYVARFGVPPPEEAEAQLNPKDQVIYWINVLRKSHKDSPGLKSCLATLRAYLTNVEQNSAEPKFKKIRKDSKAFAERVAAFPEAAEILKACGFAENPDALEIKALIADGWLCGQAAKFLEVAINQL